MMENGGRFLCPLQYLHQIPQNGAVFQLLSQSTKQNYTTLAALPAPDKTFARALLQHVKCSYSAPENRHTSLLHDPPPPQFATDLVSCTCSARACVCVCVNLSPACAPRQCWPSPLIQIRDLRARVREETRDSNSLGFPLGCLLVDLRLS